MHVLAEVVKNTSNATVSNRKNTSLKAVLNGGITHLNQVTPKRALLETENAPEFLERFCLFIKVKSYNLKIDLLIFILR